MIRKYNQQHKVAQHINKKRKYIVKLCAPNIQMQPEILYPIASSCKSLK